MRPFKVCGTPNLRATEGQYTGANALAGRWTPGQVGTYLEVHGSYKGSLCAIYYMVYICIL